MKGIIKKKVVRLLPEFLSWCGVLAVGEQRNRKTVGMSEEVFRDCNGEEKES